MDNEKSQSVIPPVQPEMTDLPPDTPLIVEGIGPSGVKAQALLAKDKSSKPDLPTDCSRKNEEIAVLYIGDAAACVEEAGVKMASSGATLFGPACGRSGINVEVIEVAANKQTTEHGKFALACHHSSKRINQRLQVKSVLITRLTDESLWDPEFKRSFFANCGDDDPGGGA